MQAELSHWFHFIVTPYQTLFTPENSSKVYEVTSLPLKWMGSSGLF